MSWTRLPRHREHELAVRWQVIEQITYLIFIKRP
jgi:hypothetical protein